MIVKISFVIFEFNTSIALFAISSGVILYSPFWYNAELSGATTVASGGRPQAGNALQRLVKCRHAILCACAPSRTQAMVRHVKSKYEPLASTQDHRPE